MSKLAVVGGGAAGMMAAISALEMGASVTLFEANPYLGKKLNITGKGRCNVTNDAECAEILKNITRNQKFLYSALFRYKPSDVMDFFENCGVPLKTERGRRVFPVSDKARDITDALEKRLTELGCNVVHRKVTGLAIANDRIKGVKIGDKLQCFDAVILATGGVSYPGTGSRGDGHEFARRAGINVTPLSSSLVPVETKERTGELMGLTLKNVTLSVFKGEKKVFSELGEMLFTHFGVSGPLVLSASAHMQDAAVCEYRFSVDLKPALSYEELDARVLSDLKKYNTRDLVNSMGDLLPKKMISPLLRAADVSERLKCCEVTKDARRRLVETLKAYPLTPSNFRPINEAIVTCGGVDVKEIDPKTLMSKKISGLFFAGELLDLDAYTGGYNLQIAWSTGRAAGESAAEYIFR